jgi:uncharacterized protein (DUF362 family)
MTKPTVVLDPLSSTPEGLHLQINNSSKRIGLEKDLLSAKAVFIKPNLTYPRYKKGVNNRVEFVENLVVALNEINYKTRIYIGEGEGGYNSFSMSEAMRDMGFFDIEKRYPNVQVVNLSKLPSYTVELEVKGRPYFIDLPRLFFDEIDFSISCPLPKVHCMTKVTLSLKNQWGCLPDTMRLKNHYVFNEIIGQICSKLKFRYAFLDGKYGLDNNGPMIGEAKRVDWFVASNSLGAFDVIVSEMMGFDWRKIGHLKVATKHGFMPRRRDIEVIGDIESLKRRFILKRSFWNYPALVAFHSKKLTHLFYFSRWAKPLHDIMYTFRKRPVEL